VKAVQATSFELLGRHDDVAVNCVTCSIANKHGKHVAHRAFIFHPTTRFEFTSHGELKHFSVGMILKRNEDNG
jgi:hypothetical protein